MSDPPSSDRPHKPWVPQVSILRPGNSQSSTRFRGCFLILLAAAVATAPILLHGSFCGDDFEFHAVSWFDVQQSWLHGSLYPHWMPSANYNAGEPRFMFYPPLSWMLGAALGSVLPWALVPVAMIFVFLAATGLAVRALAHEALPGAPATLAGCAALFSCFVLFTAYERTAFAELAGGFWIPLLLLFALRDRNSVGSFWRRAFDGSALPLTLILAGAWLSDGPVGVMASYLLAAVALTASVIARSWAHLLRAAIAATLGMALAAFYLIPAAWEQRWVDLRAAADYPVFNIENNWLFAHHTDPQLAPFQYFLHRASIIAIVMIGAALLGLSIVFLRNRYASQNGGVPGYQWIPLALVPIAVLLLQFPISLPVWNLLPKLRFLQYPWRWVLVVEAPMAIFIAAAIWPGKSATRWQRAAVATICALVFLTTTFFAARTFLRVCKEGDTMEDLLDLYRGGGGLEGTDEYEPPGSDHWKIATGLPDACFSTNSDTALGVATADGEIPEWRPEQGSCEATAIAQSRQPAHLRIATQTAHSGFLILRLLSYPAWRISVNGRPVEQADPRDDGLIAVPVPQGPVELSVDWTTTPDAITGRCVSAFAVLLLIGLGFVERIRTTPRL
ncbi:MAG: 6-pyruvoyl-tetrahydropterin synthase-related protein [Terracidiphilus sp.]